MNFSNMQSADAVLLFVISACCLIYVAEDRTLAPSFRMTISAVGFFAFAQAIWLISKYSPVQAYPWARLCLDAALAAASIVRVWKLALEAFGRLGLRHAHLSAHGQVHHLDAAPPAARPRRHVRGG